MSQVIQLSDNLIATPVIGPAGIGPLTAYTDGHRYYFTDEEIAVVADRLTGLPDSHGRRVTISQGTMGWQECRGHNQAVPLRRLHLKGRSIYRLDDEWQFRPVADTSA